MCTKNRLNEEIRKVGFVPEYRKDTWCSLLARRQREPHQTVTCQMLFMPQQTEGAGLVVMQAMNHMYKLERRKKDGNQVLMLVLSTADYDLPNYMPQFTCETKEAVIASVVWPEEDIILSVELDNETFTFRYGSDEEHLKELAVCDGALINPEKVGCMVGTMVGMYATGNGESVDNRAEFDWFELK
jgi:alpha-N-arabinofuranosidase